jgi:hypothetical protein
MDAGEEGGTLTTRPVRFSGKHLFVNADVQGGELCAELLNEDQEVIEPFSRQNCAPVSADSTCQAVEWSGGGDLSAVANKPARFRFHVENGSLYPFWVSPDHRGASNGYVAAGGPVLEGARDTTPLRRRRS